MEEPSRRHPLRLPLWIIAIALVAGLLMELFPLLFPSVYMARFAEPWSEGEEATEIEPAYGLEDEWAAGTARFHELPVEEQIAKASVIVRLEYQKTPQKLRAVVAEILKLEPGTRFYYEVGDEYPSSSRWPREGHEYGDGELLFFVGQRAMSRYSSSIYDGRLAGMGDMPLSRLRELIDGQD